jgi:hypothetical protein
MWFVYFGEEVMEKLGLKREYLDILFFCFLEDNE